MHLETVFVFVHLFVFIFVFCFLFSFLFSLWWTICHWFFLTASSIRFVKWENWNNHWQSLRNTKANNVVLVFIIRILTVPSSYNQTFLSAFWGGGGDDWGRGVVMSIKSYDISDPRGFSLPSLSLFAFWDYLSGSCSLSVCLSVDVCRSFSICISGILY